MKPKTEIGSVEQQPLLCSKCGGKIRVRPPFNFGSLETKSSITRANRKLFRAVLTGLVSKEIGNCLAVILRNQATIICPVKTIEVPKSNQDADANIQVDKIKSAESVKNLSPEEKELLAKYIRDRKPIPQPAS